MQLKNLKDALDLLGKTHFNRLWPEDAIKILAYEVEEITDKAMMETIKRVRLEISPSTFPALARIKDAMREEQAKLNVSSSPAEPRRRYENDNDFNKDFQKYGKLGEQTTKLMVGLFDGCLTKENYIEGLLVMDKAYPGIGFSQTAASLASRWREEPKGKQQPTGYIEIREAA